MADFKLGYEIVEDPKPIRRLSPDLAIENDDEMSFVEAAYRGTPINTWSRGLAQRASRAILGQNEPDPEHDPFKAWKEYGGHEYLFSDFMDTENRHQLNDLLVRLEEDHKRQKVIDKFNLSGASADFVTGIAGDPTTYMGFGVAKMLSKGAGALKSYAASGALAGGTTSLIEEYTRPEAMDLGQGAIIVGSSAAFGGILGGAVDTFAGLHAKKILKNDYETNAKKLFDDAAKAHERIDNFGSAGAMATPDDFAGYDAGVAGNKVLRTASKLVGKGLQSPRLLVQGAESPTVSTFGARFYNSNLKSKSNEEGVALKGISFGPEAEQIRNIDQAWIIENLNPKKFEIKHGRKMTEFDQRVVAETLFRVARERGKQSKAKSANNMIPALESKLDPLQKEVYDKANEFFQSKSDEFIKYGVPKYSSRKDYGMPIRFSQEKIAQNMEVFRDRIMANLVKMRDEADGRLAELRKAWEGAHKRYDETPDPVLRGAVLARIEYLEDVMEKYRVASAATDDELAEEASSAAFKFSEGKFKREGQLTKLPKGVAVSKSGFFNERVIDPLDFMDFLDLDFNRLAVSYSDSTSPHLALKKAFPEYNGLEEVVEGMRVKASMEKRGASPEVVRSIDKELDKAESLFRSSWDLETGVLRANAADAMGDLAPIATTLNSAAYITQMAGQVMAGLTEPLNGMIFHGLKYGTNLASVAKNMASDPLFREITNEQARALGVGIEVGMADMRMALVGSEISQIELSSKVAKTAKKGSILFSKLNGSVFYDSITRKSAMVAQDSVLKESIDNFSTISKERRGDLAFLGIDKDNIDIISEQMRLHGTYYKGAFFSQPQKWTDRKAAEIWIRALRKDQRRIVSQADLGDTSHFTRTPLGEIFLKYKTWPIVATQKLFLGAGQQGSRSLAGIGTIVLLASMLELVEEKALGRDPSTDVDEVIYGGIVRAGLTGLIPEIGGSALLNRLANMDAGGARYYDYMGIPEVVAGPVGAMVEDVVTATAGVALPRLDGDKLSPGYKTKSGELSKAKVNAVINLLPIPFPLVKPAIKEPVYEALR